jgi:hypothetical protein
MEGNFLIAMNLLRGWILRSRSAVADHAGAAVFSNVVAGINELHLSLLFDSRKGGAGKSGEPGGKVLGELHLGDLSGLARER